MITNEELKRGIADVYTLLDEKGWIQGHLKDDEGRNCLLNAIGQVKPERAALYVAVKAAIGSSLPIGAGSIVLWNDADGRTKEQVLKAVKRAADKDYTPEEIQKFIDVQFNYVPEGESV